MPQLPIPDDWNGEDWLCLQVQWPDSVKYRAILAGFLSYLGRGRAYDAQTGSITDAQEIGWAIFDRNMPMTPCAGRDDEESPIEQPSIGELPCDWCYEGVNEECSEMTCCIDALEWRNDGELWYRQCGKWYLVEGGKGYPVLPDDDIKEAPDEETANDWACSKATVIAEKLWQIAQYALDHYNDLNFIWAIQDNVGLDLSNAQLLGMQEFLIASSILQLENFQTVITEANKTELICRLSRVLDGSNNDIGAEQTQKIADAVRSLTSVWTDPLNWTFISQCVNSVGRENWRIVTRNSVLTPGNCCPPEGIDFPAGTTWAKDFDLTSSLYTGAVRGNKSAFVEGQGIVADITANFDWIAGYEIARPSPAATSQLLYVELHYSAWPTAPGHSVANWSYHHPNVLNNLATFWGRAVISFETNETVNQGETLQFGNAGCGNSDPQPSGQSILTRIIIAGSGEDPYPDVPDYTP